jgi:hypothetical protein
MSLLNNTNRSLFQSPLHSSILRSVNSSVNDSFSLEPIDEEEVITPREQSITQRIPSAPKKIIPFNRVQTVPNQIQKVLF